jgi:hypothetical protein
VEEVGKGAAGSGGDRPPPLQADFTITLSSASLSIMQGAASAPVTFSVTAMNGFSGTVVVALSGLPEGIVSNPVSPFSASSGQTVPVVFGAASDSGERISKKSGSRWSTWSAIRFEL